LGPSQNGINPGNFRWKMFNTVGYRMGDWTGALQWQHLPSIKSAESVFDPTTPIGGASSYDLFNLNGSYALSEDISIRFGVDNVFDKAPPINGVNSAASGFTLPGGVINDVLYDVNGRRFYVGAQVKF
jgi:outer membrane receptor protein involved in Fe transport